MGMPPCWVCLMAMVKRPALARLFFCGTALLLQMGLPMLRALLAGRVRQYVGKPAFCRYSVERLRTVAHGGVRKWQR